LERFWTDSHINEAWKRIGELEFEFVTSCMFSVWYDNPRFDQIYNLERNLYTHELFSRMGIPSIPFMLFSRERWDYHENVEWLKSNKQITIVAVRGQNRKDQSEFLELIEEMDAIRREVERTLHFLVVGISAANRIAALLQGFDATIVTGKPFQSAAHGDRSNRDLTYDKDLQATREDIFINNTRVYDSYCNSLSRALIAEPLPRSVFNVDVTAGKEQNSGLQPA
jgi:hypothetical protein